VATDPYKYFRVEARELLSGMGQGVLDLEKGGWDADVVAKLLRLAHTLKGAARVVKLAEVAEQAHAFEEALGPYRRGPGPLSEGVSAVLLELCDAMGAKVAAIDAAETTAASVPQPSPAALGPAADEAFDTVRIEVREMDDLLEGVTEATVQLNTLRREGEAIERVQRVAGLLVEQLSVRRTGDLGAGSARLLSLAEDLKRSLDAVQQGVSIGVAQVGSELEQVREAANRLRLIPASSLFAPLERVARDAAQSLQKAVVFQASGGETRLDAHVLLELRGPLVQLVRNAVAHGIESTEDRRRGDKPPAGRVEIVVERRGDKVAVHCRDDGRGVDVEALRRAVVSRGVVSSAEARALDLQGVFALVLRGGVSTTRNVTEVSGRGIGLDVVREAAARLKGEVRVRSEPARGTDVELCVPVSLFGLSVLQFDVAGSAASVPLDSVCTTMRLHDTDIARSGAGDSVLYEGQAIPFFSLAPALRRSSAVAAKRKYHSAVVVRSGGALAAVGVDRLVGAAAVVVRPLPAEAEAEPIVAGASLDAEGNPQLVLDPKGVLASARTRQGERAAADDAPRLPLLIIDDSLTTRMLEQSILESAGFEVHVAASAEEGLAKAAQQTFGVFVVDVEMPGMDGFEFVTRTRADPVLRATPAVLLTSRESDDDKRRGRDAGASAYIVKGEFDQGVLLRTIRGLVGGP
jgi:two-component system chemotaxis sensor kinase CheA